MEFRRAKKPSLDLSIAPLVDIVFLLLIFFLLTSSFQNPAIQLTLPEAQSESYQEKRPVTVSLDDNGRLFIDMEEVTMDEFPEKLAALMKQNDNRDIVFRGSKDLRYEQVLQIMGLAKKAGADSIDLVHRVQQ